MSFLFLFTDLVASFSGWWLGRIAELSAARIDDPEQWKYSFWAALASALISAYAARKSAKEQQRISEEARKGTTTTQTSIPYMNEYISKLIPYILQEQQKIYESRLKGYGLKPGDYSPIAKMLSGISPNYSGISGQFGGSNFGQGASDPMRQQIDQMNRLTPEQEAQLNEYAKQNNISRTDAARALYGPDGLERSPGSRFDRGSGSPFFGGGFSGVPAGDAKAAGDWLSKQFSGGKGGDWLMRMLLGFNPFGGGSAGSSKFSGTDGSSLFGQGEWSAGKEPLK